MKRLYKYLAVFLIISAGVSCNRKMAPSQSEMAKDPSYDVARFDYYFVEAIKQKVLGNFGDALKYLEQCVKINPASDAAYYQMGQVLASGGDIRNAKKYLLKAILIDEKNMWYLVSLSGVYYQEKNLDSAIIYYEKAVQYFPDNENLQLTLGNLYIENSRFQKANSIFDAFDRKYGVNDASTLLSVRSLMAEKKYEEAGLKIQELLKQKPDDMMYNGLFAEILRAKGEDVKANEIYEKLIEKNPDDPQLNLSYADFLVARKDYDKLFMVLNGISLNAKIRKEDKIAFFAKLLEIPEIYRDREKSLTLALMVLEADYKDDNIVPLLRPDLYVRTGKLPEAAARLEAIVNAKPENYPAWEKLLLVYLEQKDWQKLTTKGKECATMFNMSFLAKILYSNGLIETGKYDAAIEELKKAWIIAGENSAMKVQVLTMRADAYYRMKNYDMAFQTFEEALKVNINDLTVLNNYAYYLAEQNMKLKEAEELSRKVIETEKDNTTFLDTYGWVLYKRGKINEAGKVFESIIKSGGEPDAEWYEHYGYVLKKQKKCEKAAEYWKIAIKLDGTKTNLVNEIENCAK